MTGSTNQVRRTVMVACASVVMGGLLGSGSALAGPSPISTGSASVTCNTVIGTASIKPAITFSSTDSLTIKVKATLGGCTVTGAPVTIVSGSIAGTLSTMGSANCTSLAPPNSVSVTGNLVAKWKVQSGQKLDSSSTTFAVSSIAGGIFTPGAPLPGSYGQFTVSGNFSSGAFGNPSPSASIVAVTGEDVNNFAAQCTTGLKTVHLAIGTLTL